MILDNGKLMECVDMLDNMDEDIENLINMLYVVKLGIEKSHYGNKKCEVGCIHVINRYLNTVSNEYVKPVRNLMEEIIKSPSDGAEREGGSFDLALPEGYKEFKAAAEETVKTEE